MLHIYVHKKCVHHDFIIGIVFRSIYLQSNFEITSRITLHLVISGKVEKKF